MPSPRDAAQDWTFALQQRVHYTPYATGTATSVEPLGYRVIGRMYTELVQMRPLEQYVIEPWALTGQWAGDRPMVVFREQLTPYQEEEPRDA